MNLNTIWSSLEDVYDILGGYGFAAMDKAATEMELKPGWSTGTHHDCEFHADLPVWAGAPE